ncbi:phage major tail tube protein [Bosea vaviloviae]|uniref:phage major tail tube protein n=1 Tax=Bosea vaviloviae TaxID=1526658 RepID=UPI0006BAD08F|nr:phage major tail tube protein [Bosea vaviloviae]
MARIPFLVVRGANMLAEDANGQTLNGHLALSKIKLPMQREKYDEFSPAANNGSIEVATTREPCMAGFDMKGMQPEVLTLFRTPFGARRKFTVLGALVNEYATSAADRETQVVATMYGRLNVETDDIEGGSLTGTQYEIKSISSYLLTIGTAEIARFNIELGGWVDSEGQQQRIANMIGLSS